MKRRSVGCGMPISSGRRTLSPWPSRRITTDSPYEEGSVDTVLLCIADMEGRLQGKRLTAAHFLDDVVEHGTALLGDGDNARFANLQIRIVAEQAIGRHSELRARQTAA